MKKLFSSSQSAEVELLKNMLADAEIDCEARNAAVSAVIPAAPFYEELWVSDEDYAKATELLESWQQTPSSQAASWTCAACGEVNEAQFSSCWKCGAKRAEAAPAG
jgi:hypothetical protein